MASRPPWLNRKALALGVAATALLAVALVCYVMIETSSPPPAAKVPHAASETTTQERKEMAAPRAHANSPDAARREELKTMVAAIIGPETAADIRGWADTLQKGDGEQRADAIRELGFLDDPRWLPVVISVLGHDEDATVRSAAAAELATQSTSPAAAHALAATLTDSDPDVRENALLSLKAIRNATVEEDLRRLLAEHRLDAETTQGVRLLLDRLYVHKDPLADPLSE